MTQIIADGGKKLQAESSKLKGTSKNSAIGPRGSSEAWPAEKLGGCHWQSGRLNAGKNFIKPGNSIRKSPNPP